MVEVYILRGVYGVYLFGSEISVWRIGTAWPCIRRQAPGVNTFMSPLRTLLSPR